LHIAIKLGDKRILRVLIIRGASLAPVVSVWDEHPIPLTPIELAMLLHQPPERDLIAALCHPDSNVTMTHAEFYQA